MKTTLEIPDDLMRAIKIRAAREDKKLKDMVAELLRRGMAAEERPSEKRRHRVQFPIVRTSHPAPSGQEPTPERVHEILLEQEVEAALRGAGFD